MTEIRLSARQQANDDASKKKKKKKFRNSERLLGSADAEKRGATPNPCMLRRVCGWLSLLSAAKPMHQCQLSAQYAVIHQRRPSRHSRTPLPAAASLLVISSFPTSSRLPSTPRAAGTQRRRTPLTGRSRPPSAVDICFPFVYSAAVIHGRRRRLR